MGRGMGGSGAALRDKYSSGHRTADSGQRLVKLAQASVTPFCDQGQRGWDAARSCLGRSSDQLRNLLGAQQHLFKLRRWRKSD